MHHVLVAGSGKIGSLIACLLHQTQDYEIVLVDANIKSYDCHRLAQKFPDMTIEACDMSQTESMTKLIKQYNISSVISCLPYFLNLELAKLAAANQLHYLDLTEDVKVTTAISELAAKASSCFIPQCGLAPGFIGIAAHGLALTFDKVDKVQLRVGALPQRSNHALKYALTWSTEGLINEYGNLCEAILNHERVLVPALQGLEALEIDGEVYEAFNTSGGLGSLTDAYLGKARELNYKTIRYPGHCEKIRFLMEDLRLNDDRETLKKVFEHSVPRTNQDVIVIYVSVAGERNGIYMEESYRKKIYPQQIAGMHWSGIQISTAAGLCAVLDMFLSTPNQYPEKGLITQVAFGWREFLSNRFGSYYSV